MSGIAASEGWRGSASRVNDSMKPLRQDTAESTSVSSRSKQIASKRRLLFVLVLLLVVFVFHVVIIEFGLVGKDTEFLAAPDGHDEVFAVRVGGRNDALVDGGDECLHAV